MGTGARWCLPESGTEISYHTACWSPSYSQGRLGQLGAGSGGGHAPSHTLESWCGCACPYIARPSLKRWALASGGGGTPPGNPGAAALARGLPRPALCGLWSCGYRSYSIDGLWASWALLHPSGWQGLCRLLPGCACGRAPSAARGAQRKCAPGL